MGFYLVEAGDHGGEGDFAVRNHRLGGLFGERRPQKAGLVLLHMLNVRQESGKCVQIRRADSRRQDLGLAGLDDEADVSKAGYNDPEVV